MRSPTQDYIDLGKSLGKKLVEYSWDLVYGGACEGIMTAVADSVLEHGGHAYGVFPQKMLGKEKVHTGLTELISVNTMHERKEKMYDLADAFLILPGGFGTLDELFEVLTWSKLDHHQEPIFILNHLGFYDLLMNHLRYIQKEGFIDHEDFLLVHEVTSIEKLFHSLSHVFKVA